jgi:hypothetical protein
MSAVSFVCDKCGTPPWRLLYEQSDDKDSIFVKAYCHGKWDEMTIPNLTLLGDPNVVLFEPNDEEEKLEESS